MSPRTCSLLAGVCAAACLSVLVPVAAHATFPGQNGRIAFGSRTSGVVWTSRPDGSRDRRVLRDARWHQWSADGRRLIYERGEDELWQASSDGSRRSVIIRARDHDIGHNHWTPDKPAFSPDGRMITFDAAYEVDLPENPDEDDDLAESRRDVYVADIDGPRARRLRSDAHDATWSPNGDIIAFVTKRNGIATIRPDGSEYERMLPNIGPYRTGLDFSPDGRKLLFQQVRRANWYGSRIGILDLETRAVTRISPRVARQVLDAVWSPDGEHIAFVENDQNPPTRIWSVRPDGIGKRLLFRPPRSAAYGRWVDTLAWQSR